MMHIYVFAPNPFCDTENLLVVFGLWGRCWP